MRVRVHQIAIKLDYEPRDVLAAAARRLNCRPNELSHLVTLRRSIDARRTDAPPRFVLSIEVDVAATSAPAVEPGRIELVNAQDSEPTISPKLSRRAHRPIVVGAGPAGLLAALSLAKAGANPLLIERGAAVSMREHQVDTFRRNGTLHPDSNVLFGEGGAGLFSDGKLTSRSKNRGAIHRLFELFVELGAAPDILIDAAPHLGSDVLAHLIPRLRSRIEFHGGEVRFGARLDDLHIEDGILRGGTISGEEVETDACFLAAGHSARDVYRLLSDRGVPMAAKPFAIGLRLEMPQSKIDRAQYGRWASHPRLRNASFRITRRPDGDARACYTFCNCPGGLVMACASSPGRLTSNGMSYSSRAKPFGNAAFLVPVGPEDYPSSPDDGALAGIEFQETMERAAFVAGGGDYGLPAQSLIDFLGSRQSSAIPSARSCTRAVAADIAELLPDHIVRTLRRSLPRMLHELDGVEPEDVLVYGVETRSSSPVRILRNPKTYESTGVLGLYPLGEGAGYTGGIVSSALDGMAAVERLSSVADS
jgi:hypothetical protein